MAISDKPIRLRILAARGIAKGAVDRTGGEFGAGLINGFSAITEGEAIGHSLWIDKPFLQQVADAGNALKGGLKSRFTHPGLSGDGLGSALGKCRNFSVAGGQVKADLHLLKSAHAAPDGDLATYTMDLAEESPDLFGASIVFACDKKAMQEFSKLNEDEQGRFISPEPKNKTNLPHARLSRLSASDIVDDPAANPQGMFSASFLPGSELAARAETLLGYAFGLMDEVEETDADGEGPHPERARAFVQGFLERHGLKVVTMQDTKEEKKIAAADSAAFKKLAERVKALENKLLARQITEGAAK